MNNRFNPGDVVILKCHEPLAGIITEATEFEFCQAKITEVIQPKQPLTEYSEPRYHYIANGKRWGNRIGNIGQELLNAYVQHPEVELN